MLRLSLLALVMWFGSAPAFAQVAITTTYPDRPVHFIVPSAAGGVSDALARVIAEKLIGLWGQPVIVENYAGIVGTQKAAKSSPDGYTLLVTSNGHVVLNVINKSLSFDAVHDFAPVVQIATIPFLLISSQSTPANSLAELVMFAKTNPGLLNMGIPGAGTASNIISILFKQELKLEVTDVPFRGAADAHVAALRGDVDIHFSAVNVGRSLVQSGRVKALAVATDDRLQILPEVPTFVEAGFPSLNFDGWFGLLAPAGISQSITQKIYADVVKILEMPDVRAALDRQGFIIRLKDPALFAASFNADASRYGKALKAVGATSE